MGFFLGLLMCFICHTVANIFANNAYCWFLETKIKKTNQYLIKQYITKTFSSLVIYGLLLVVVLTVPAFSEFVSAILIGNGIGFATGAFHFMLIADNNYNKQKTECEGESLTETIVKEEKTKQINKEEVDCNSEENDSYVELVERYLKNEKDLNVNIETAPNGDKIITIDYQINYLWTVCIKIDAKKGMIKIYTPFFRSSFSKGKELWEYLNELNRISAFAKFSFDHTEAFLSSCATVIAQYDVPLANKESVPELTYAMMDKFIYSVDEFFAEIPKDLISF